MILSASTMDDSGEVVTLDRAADHDLERRVRIYLGSRFHPALSRLGVSVHRGCVSLTGTVHSYYERQLAVSTCKRVAGVHAVLDDVVVAADQQPTRTSATFLASA